MVLKKGDIRHYGPTLFQVMEVRADKTAEIKIINLIPETGADVDIQIVDDTIQSWMNWREFRDSVPVDEDVMQGLIMGVFGELD
jgi:hypothetical protein